MTDDTLRTEVHRRVAAILEAHRAGTTVPEFPPLSGGFEIDDMARITEWVRGQPDHEETFGLLTDITGGTLNTRAMLMAIDALGEDKA